MGPEVASRMLEEHVGVPARGVLAAICLVVSLLLPRAAGLGAQVIQGGLLDEDTGEPIDGGTVTLLDMDGNRVGVSFSDGGVFSVAAPATGRYRLRADRLGYQRATSPPLDVREGEVVQVEFRLSMQAIPLAPLRVVSGRPALVLDPYLARKGYYEREDRYDATGAHFLDWREVRARHPSTVTGVLRTLPGVRVHGAGGRQVRITNLRGEPLFLCLDGMRFGTLTAGGLALDELVLQSQVVGMEVYTGLVRDVQYIKCSLIVWTGIPPDDVPNR